MSAAVGTAGSLARRPRRLAALAVPPAIAAAIFIGIWYLSSFVQFKDPFLRNSVQPYPHDVVQASYLTSRNLTEMLHALWRTAQVALTGLAIAIVVGVSLAILMSMSRTIERALFPYAVILQTIPIVAVTPLLIIWFGTGQMPRIVVCVLISVFPITTNTLFGMHAADRSQHNLFTLHGANRLTRLWKLKLPASLPAMFTGFRISAGLCVVGAIVGEFFFKSGPEGIGRRIGQYTQRSETNKLIGAVSMTAALGLALFLVFAWLGNRVTRHWRAGARVAS